MTAKPSRSTPPQQPPSASNRPKVPGEPPNSGNLGKPPEQRQPSRFAGDPEPEHRRGRYSQPEQLQEPMERRVLDEDMLDDEAGPQSSARSWWLAGGLAVLAAIAPYIWFSFRRPAVVAAPTSESVAGATASRLGFHASRENGDWRLMWDRDAVAKLEPIGGMLTINDGGAERVQFLAPVDLASGFLLYVPRSGDLMFNLTITSANGDTQERVRVLGPQFPSPSQSYSSQRVPAVTADSSRATPASHTDTARVTQPGQKDTSQDAPSGGAPSSSATAAAPRTFTPPASASTTAAPKLVSEVDLPQVSLPASAAPALPRGAAVAPPPHPVSPPSQPVQPPPAQSKPPVSAAGRPATHSAPIPVRMIAATWPRMVARRSPMEVQVRVHVDAYGKVVQATPVQRTVANYEFVNSATTAAMTWLFTPAKENGRPVAGEAVLTFKFRP